MSRRAESRRRKPVKGKFDPESLIDEVITRQEARDPEYERKVQSAQREASISRAADISEETLRRREEVEQLRTQRQRSLHAITSSDLVCEPVTQPLKDFKEVRAENLLDLLESLSKAGGAEDPKFDSSVLVGPRDISRVYQRQRLQGSGAGGSKVEELHVVNFRSRLNTNRVAIGVKCRARGKAQHIQAVNINRNDINSQQFIQKAIYRSMIDLSMKERTVQTRWTIYIEPVLGAAEASPIPLINGSDRIYISVPAPLSEQERDVDLPSLETIPQSVRYFNEKIQLLQEEQHRVQLQLQQEIDDLKAQQKRQTERVLGKHGFVGAVNKLAECYINSFSPPDGHQDEDEYFRCISELVQQDKFFRDIEKIGKHRKGSGLASENTPIDKLYIELSPKSTAGGPPSITPALTAFIERVGLASGSRTAGIEIKETAGITPSEPATLTEGKGYNNPPSSTFLPRSREEEEEAAGEEEEALIPVSAAQETRIPEDVQVQL